MVPLVNEKLDDCQKQLLIVQKDNEFLEGEVLVKQQTLSDLRVEICRWSARQKELERQKRKLQEEVASLEASAQLLEQHGDRERYMHAVCVHHDVINTFDTGKRL